MNKDIPFKISPRFDSRKLINATFDDFVDIYQDRVNGWLVEWGHELNKHEHAGFAVLQIALAFFEGFAVFYYGEDSKNKSKEFFSRGFRLVFPQLDNLPKKTAEDITDMLYYQGRCGLFHLGMVKSGIFLRDGDYEFSIHFDNSGQVASIFFDRYKFIQAISKALARYIQRLHDPSELELREKFMHSWKLVHQS